MSLRQLCNGNVCLASWGYLLLHFISIFVVSAENFFSISMLLLSHKSTFSFSHYRQFFGGCSSRNWGRPRLLRWKNKSKHCFGWFVVRENHYSGWKTSWKVRIIREAKRAKINKTWSNEESTVSGWFSRLVGSPTVRIINQIQVSPTLRSLEAWQLKILKIHAVSNHFYCWL